MDSFDHCKLCNPSCCELEIPFVLQEERDRIVQETGKDPFVESEGYYILPSPCEFVSEERKCSIQDIKPLDCQIFPYRIDEEGNIQLDESCLMVNLHNGFSESSLALAEQLKSQITLDRLIDYYNNHAPTTIPPKTYIEDRALFKARALKLIKPKFDEGVSALKHSSDVQIIEGDFFGKYPLWHSQKLIIRDSLFNPSARTGVWYSSDMRFMDCIIHAPKYFRECSDLTLKDVKMTSSESLWKSRNIRILDSDIAGLYIGLDTSDIEICGGRIRGRYPFQYTSNSEFDGVDIHGKDAFWHAKDTVVRDSTIHGTYVGWHSQNLVFENCNINSDQPFCYATNVKLIDCSLNGAKGCFEYSTVNANITDGIGSIKNPLEGRVIAPTIEEVIFDDSDIDPQKTRIEQKV